MHLNIFLHPVINYTCRDRNAKIEETNIYSSKIQQNSYNQGLGPRIAITSFPPGLIQQTKLYNNKVINRSNMDAIF